MLRNSCIRAAIALAWAGPPPLSSQKGTLDTNLNEAGDNLVALLHMVDWQYGSENDGRIGNHFTIGNQVPGYS